MHRRGGWQLKGFLIRESPRGRRHRRLDQQVVQSTRAVSGRGGRGSSRGPSHDRHGGGVVAAAVVGSSSRRGTPFPAGSWRPDVPSWRSRGRSTLQAVATSAMSVAIAAGEMQARVHRAARSRRRESAIFIGEIPVVAPFGHLARREGCFRRDSTDATVGARVAIWAVNRRRVDDMHLVQVDEDGVSQGLDGP